MAPYHVNLFSLKGITNLMERFGFSFLDKYNIQNNWYFTKAIVDKLGLQKHYTEWRKSSAFVNFDIEVDRVFDEISYQNNNASVILLLFQKS